MAKKSSTATWVSCSERGGASGFCLRERAGVDGSVGGAADKRSASDGRRVNRDGERTDEWDVDALFVDIDTCGESISEA